MRDNGTQGADPMTFAGFDVMCKRMGDAKHMCEDFANYVKSR